jgi:hypothetical protein
MTISIRNAMFPVWTQLSAPTAERPYWHEEDGARHSFMSLLAGMAPQDVKALRDMHAAAVAGLLKASMEAHDTSSHDRARALATAAGRLCQETIGLFPPSAAIPTP